MSLVGGSILRGRDDRNSDIAREYRVGRYQSFAITVPICPRLRRIAIQFLKDISRGWWWRGLCQSKSPDRSHGWPLLFSCRVRTLPCRPIRHARPIVVPHRIPLHPGERTGTTDWTGKHSGNAGTCVHQADARTKRQRWLRSCPHSLACGAGFVRSNTCSRRPSDITKPGGHHAAVATGRNVCPEGNLCAGFGRDNR